MPGYRYHAFSEAPIYEIKPQSPARVWSRLWTRLVAKIFWKIEQMQLEMAMESFLKGAVLGAHCRMTARAWCVNPGARENIRIGNGVVCRGLVRSERFHPGKIIIGDDVYLGDDTIISAADLVEIGSATMLAHGVQIFDNDSHPLDPFLRERDMLIATMRVKGQRPEIAFAPVVVGPRSWVGLNSIILRGVTIGEGAVVAAGSVVTKDVPPYTLVAGNPANVVKNISLESFSTTPADGGHARG